MARLDRTSIERVMAILVEGMFWGALLPCGCSLAPSLTWWHVLALPIAPSAAPPAPSVGTVYRVD
ncbi:hypothetical protein A2U01_0088377 [Trifolium medium]|uniref:Uncharacterized protein n=1 Tax=Trifolium medium TaxID=97028 RepID=A0A392U170_9FABA|nr:hypothetical protein [Trifolium medium]